MLSSDVAAILSERELERRGSDAMRVRGDAMLPLRLHHAHRRAAGRGARRGGGSGSDKLRTRLVVEPVPPVCYILIIQVGINQAGMYGS